MVENQANSSDRLLALDFFRGLTMFLLIGEFSYLYFHLVSSEFSGTFIYSVGMQFHHVQWEGLRFWDLIQPFFMFIVGVAMPLSFSKRLEKGDSYGQLRSHTFKRSFLLLIYGWGLYCISAGEIVFLFQNVLAQLAVTYLLAFLVMRKSVAFQIGFSALLLLITELLYRLFPVEGFDQAFTAGENFGAWFNILISGEEGDGHWAMFNAIPTAVHTIMGVLVGQLLMGNFSAKKKLGFIVGAGVLLLIVGYGLSPITPIIKRISTSTFVLVSGGWTLLAFALCYWLIDMLKYQRGVWFFSIVGLNPLAIYLFAHVGGAYLVMDVVEPFSNALFGWAGELAASIILSTIVLFSLWYICFWMYQRKIFIRI